MNTIEGLKKLPGIIEKLINERISINSQISACYKPFHDIIVKVFLHSKEWGNSMYVDYDDIDISEDTVRFSIRFKEDDEVESTHEFPIEAFVSAETLIQYICDKNEREAKAKLAKEAHNKLMAEKALEEAERATYLALKKKFEGT